MLNTVTHPDMPEMLHLASACRKTMSASDVASSLCFNTHRDQAILARTDPPEGCRKTMSVSDVASSLYFNTHQDQAILAKTDLSEGCQSDDQLPKIS